MAITKEMSIGAIVQSHPETVRVFLNHGLMCVGCAAARVETPNLVGHDGETSPGRAGPRCLDCGVECQKVGLIGDIRNHPDDAADFANAAFHARYGVVHPGEPGGHASHGFHGGCLDPAMALE